MRAALYARVSTSKQELEQTIQSQLESIMEYVSKERFELDKKHIYIDEGYSGTKLERPSLDALRDSAAFGEFQKIVIYSLSPSAVISEPKKIKCVTVSTVFPFICHEVMGLDAMIFIF